MELQTHFDDFRTVVAAQIKELVALGPKAGTTEWYLLKYFRRIHKKVTVSTSAREVENSIRALIRFYLDAIDEGSELELRCKTILQSHNRALRFDRRS
ncbi:MAG: hypothetical protein O3C28_17185 [Proteobacteria bacterium]|nr:hypothetical protein [Pseudomonadota bacterium]